MSSVEKPTEISKKARIRLSLGAWAVALAITPLPFCIGTSPVFLFYFIFFAWAFPIGLAELLLPTDGYPSQSDGYAFVVIGWIFYVALTIAGISQRKRSRYYFTFAVLCALLILNVVGCNVGINTLKGGFGC